MSRVIPLLGMVGNAELRDRSGEMFALYRDGVEVRLLTQFEDEFVRSALAFSGSYAEQCVEALRLAKAWIEHCDRDGTMEEQIARADAYNAKYPEKTFWTPDYDRAARAIVAALSIPSTSATKETT